MHFVGDEVGSSPGAVVIGSGPNGLAAAIRLAQAGFQVLVKEAAATPGGGIRSAALTLPGFIHDPCAAVFPVAAASPFLRQLELERHGLTWIEPPLALAHPLDDGRAAVLDRSIERTAESLAGDRDVYVELMRPLVDDAHALVPDLLAPPGSQRHPLALARFGQHAIRSAAGFTASHFHGDEARVLVAGCAAHSFLPLEAPLTAGYGLFLTLLGHAVGWPIPRGGAGNLAAALVAVLQSTGATIETGRPVRTLAELPDFVTVFFDTDPWQSADIAGPRLPSRFRARLRRHRFGPAAFKIDYALDGPIPWLAKACTQAGTIHVGGRFEEIALSEREVTRGRHPERPFVIVSQPSLFDDTRAPRGKHVLWAYCHVPAGSDFDMSERIEQQIERFAPGFRDRILFRHVMRPAALQAMNANLVGGAINGGLQDLRAYLRWALDRPSPYATPDPALYQCSSAAPPGGGVHGMAGYHAAEFAIRRQRRDAAAV
jgi:phytoene dehydrogenase-like protein